MCPTCVYEGHAPAASPTKQRKSRGRFAAPQVLLEGLSLEELAEAAADPLLGKAQRKAARAQLREEKRRLKEEKVAGFASGIAAAQLPYQAADIDPGNTPLHVENV